MKKIKLFTLCVLCAANSVVCSAQKITYVSKAPSANHDKATVTLKDEGRWTEAMNDGVVLFIGTDLKFNTGSSAEYNYENAEYKIPANSAYDANSEEITGTVRSIGTASATIEIDEGLYKYNVIYVNTAGNPERDVVCQSTTAIFFEKVGSIFLQPTIA